MTFLETDSFVYLMSSVFVFLNEKMTCRRLNSGDNHSTSDLMRCKLVRLIIKTIFGSRITVQSNFYPMRILGNVIVKANYTIFSGSFDFPVTKECVLSSFNVINFKIICTYENSLTRFV